MSSPTTPSAGYAAQGVTTIIWGTDTLFGAYVVNRFNVAQLAENIKLPNGTGITTTRIQLIDGAKFDIVVRDDTLMSAPRVGTILAVKDGGGLLGGAIGASYNCRVCESSWEAAPKTAAERTVSAESLILITET